MRILSLYVVTVIALFGSWRSASAAAAIDALSMLPPASQNLVLRAPIRNWDEAIPLGNGLTGGLLWGEGGAIHLGLDRGDLWDERTNGPKEWWKTQTWVRGGGMWEGAYYGAYPSKLPAGRVEITLPSGEKVKTFELNYATAEGMAHLADGTTATVFFSAVEPVTLLRLAGVVPENIEVLSPLAVVPPANAADRPGRTVIPLMHWVTMMPSPAARATPDGTYRKRPKV